MLTTSSVHAGPVPDTTINYNAVASFTINERIRIDARINDSEGVNDVRCYFKADQDNSYLYVSMHQQSANDFQCELPAFGPGVQSLEYFFLTVNGNGQVIRSTPYRIRESASVLSPDEQLNGLSTGELEVYSELGDTALENTSIVDSNILFMTTQHTEQLYGLRAGVYRETDKIPDSLNVMPGFFGGFILNPADNTVEPAQGFAPNMKLPGEQFSTQAEALLPDSTTETTTEPVNIAGDDWVGYFYRSDSNFKIYLTASIGQNNSQVEITTTLSDLGHHLAGSINSYGDMLLYDSYDGEDWTTHFGPANSVKVKIYDYVRPFEPGEPIPPLNAIILYRPPLPPSGLEASDGIFRDKVTLNWNLSDGATSYLVYACISDSTAHCQLLATIDSNHYENTRENRDIVYYRVKACDELCSEYSNDDTGYPALLSPMTPILNLLL